MASDENIYDHPLSVEKKISKAERYLAANKRAIERLVDEFLEVASTAGDEAPLRLLTCINHLNHYAQKWSAKSGATRDEVDADNYGAFSEAVAKMLPSKRDKKFTREGRENYTYCIATLYQMAEQLTRYNPTWVSELNFWCHLSNTLIMDFRIEQKHSSIGMEISCLVPELQKERQAQVISAYQEVKIKELYHKLLADLWMLRNEMESKINFDKEVERILEQMAWVGLSGEERNQSEVKVKEIYHWLLANLWTLRDKMRSKEEQANYDQKAELILEKIAGIGLLGQEGELSKAKAKEMYNRLVTQENWKLQDGIQDKKAQANFAVEHLLQQMPGISLSKEQGNKPTWFRVCEALDNSSLNNYQGVNEAFTQFKLQLTKLIVLSPKLPFLTNVSQKELINIPFVKYWEKFVNWIKGLFDLLFNQGKHEEAIELQTLSKAEESEQRTSPRR